ncbi:MAG: hypothetical protein AAGC60_30125 [Acidobacteriota bacterium]
MNEFYSTGLPSELLHPVVDAIEFDDRLVVLFDPNAKTSKFGQFANLIALSRGGELLWTAELPTTTSGDRYYKLTPGENLRAASVYSFVCEIDPETGRILRKQLIR